MSLEDKRDLIDHGGPKLVWQQVFDDIRSEITSGKLAPGVKMPTELELASQYGVSRVTVRRVVKELSGLGLLEVVHGRGTFVSQPDEGK